MPWGCKDPKTAGSMLGILDSELMPRSLPRTSWFPPAAAWSSAARKTSAFAGGGFGCPSFVFEMVSDATAAAFAWRPGVFIKRACCAATMAGSKFPRSCETLGSTVPKPTMGFGTPPVSSFPSSARGPFAFGSEPSSAVSSSPFPSSLLLFLLPAFFCISTASASCACGIPAASAPKPGMFIPCLANMARRTACCPYLRFSWRWNRRRLEWKRFLMAFSVLPGRYLAISAHWLPSSFW
mmetsp:Transcript_18835/g.71304  ORF Transcript_18835/g.71304 Transcript_18835/m.71304 type:complete len:238 (-) Transcript_18835:558-1271(-)